MGRRVLWVNPREHRCLHYERVRVTVMVGVRVRVRVRLALGLRLG